MGSTALPLPKDAITNTNEAKLPADATSAPTTPVSSTTLHPVSSKAESFDDNIQEQQYLRHLRQGTEINWAGQPIEKVTPNLKQGETVNIGKIPEKPLSPLPPDMFQQPEAAAYWYTKAGHPTAAKTALAIAGVRKGLTDSVKNLIDPANLAFLVGTEGLGEVVPIITDLINAGFTTYQIKTAIDTIPNVRTAIRNHDPETAAQLMTEGGIATAFSVVGTLHGIKEIKKTSKIKPENIDIVSNNSISFAKDSNGITWATDKSVSPNPVSIPDNIPANEREAYAADKLKQQGETAEALKKRLLSIPGAIEVKSQATSAPSLFDKAAEHYGTTTEVKKAGYIGQDGRMLDFSDGGNVRRLDHGDISSIKGVQSERNSNPRIDFTAKTGAVRVLQNADSVMLAFDKNHTPTAAQLEPLLSSIEKGKKVLVDVTSPDFISGIVGSADALDVHDMDGLRRVITDAQKDAAQSETSVQPWMEEAAKNAKGGFSVNPQNGKAPTKGKILSILPEAEIDLGHPATPEDIRDYYNKHKALFDAHPELHIGGYGNELNISAIGPNAEAVAKKLDQHSIYDLGEGKEILTGGKNKQKSFPDYSLEQRLADLKGDETDNAIQNIKRIHPDWIVPKGKMDYATLETAQHLRNYLLGDGNWISADVPDHSTIYDMVGGKNIENAKGIRVAEKGTYDISHLPTVDQMEEIARLYKASGRRNLTWDLYPKNGNLSTGYGSLGDLQRAINDAWPSEDEVSKTSHATLAPIPISLKGDNPAITDESIHGHEYGHGAQAIINGARLSELRSYMHPESIGKATATAITKWPSGGAKTYDEWITKDPNNALNIIQNALAGPLTQEVLYGVPMIENPGARGDMHDISYALHSLGLTLSQQEDVIDYLSKDWKDKLTEKNPLTGKTLGDIIKQYAPRDEDIRAEILASPYKIDIFAEEVRQHENEVRQHENRQREGNNRGNVTGVSEGTEQVGRENVTRTERLSANSDISKSLRAIPGAIQVTAKYTPKGSAVPLLEKPLPTEAGAQRTFVPEKIHQGISIENPVIADFQRAMGDWMKKTAGSIKEPDANLKRSINLAHNEINHWIMENGGEGKGWYRRKTDAAIKVLSKAHPQLKDPAHATIFKALWTAHSYGNDPDINMAEAEQNLSNLEDKGKIEYDKGTKTNGETLHWSGHTGNVYTLSKTQHLIDKYGEDGAAKWLTTKHPWSEIQNEFKASGLNVSKHGIALDKDGKAYGAMAFGPKGGAFFLNLNGINDHTTVDIWGARALRRWEGRIGSPDTLTKDYDSGLTIDRPPDSGEISRFHKVIQSVAKKLNIDTDDVQALQWYFEHKLYEVHGVGEKARDYEEAAKNVINKKGTGEPINALDLLRALGKWKSPLQSRGNEGAGVATPKAGQNAVSRNLFENH